MKATLSFNAASGRWDVVLQLDHAAELLEFETIESASSFLFGQRLHRVSGNARRGDVEQWSTREPPQVQLDELHHQVEVKEHALHAARADLDAAQLALRLVGPELAAEASTEPAL